MFSIFYSDFLMSKVQKSLFLLISIPRYANQNSCVKSVIIGLISGAASGGLHGQLSAAVGAASLSLGGRKAESCLEPATLPLSHLQLRHEASCRALWQTEQEPPRGCCWRSKKARNVAKLFFEHILPVVSDWVTVTKTGVTIFYHWQWQQRLTSSSD